MSQPTPIESTGSADPTALPVAQGEPVRCGRKRNQRRRGAAAIEFALIAIPFLFLIFTMFEFGRYIMIYQILIDAAREGARRAVVESATPDDVTARVKTLLDDATLKGATITVTPSNNFDSLWLGDPVKVDVSISYGSVSWMTPLWVAGSPTISASSTMYVERPE